MAEIDDRSFEEGERWEHLSKGGIYRIKDGNALFQLSSGEWVRAVIYHAESARYQTYVRLLHDFRCNFKHLPGPQDLI
jgi:hypothetical protein